MAKETTRARIGPLVSPITFRNPAVLAKAAVTVDHISGGRLELGIGAGGSAFDHELAEVPRWDSAERLSRLRAFVERLVGCLRTSASRLHRYSPGSRSRSRGMPASRWCLRPSTPIGGTHSVGMAYRPRRDCAAAARETSG